MNAIPTMLPVKVLANWQSDPAPPVWFAGGRPESDGILFRFTRSGEPAVLKILELDDNDPDALRISGERASLMSHLGIHGVPMPQLLPAEDGASSVVTQMQGRTFRAYVMKQVAGETFGQLPVSTYPAFVEEMGAVIGRMHAATTSYPLWEGLPAQGTAHPPLHWQSEMDFFHGWMRDKPARACWERLRSRLACLPQTRQTMGFIHNDPHPWNFMWQNGTLTVLDFDVANCHFLVNDLAIALFSLLMEQTNHFIRPLDPCEADKAQNTLLHGYLRFHQLPEGWQTQLELLLLYRRLLLLCAMSDGMRTLPPHLSAMYRQALEETPVWPVH